MFIKLFCRLLVDHLQRFQVLFQVRIFKGGEKLPTHENMWWSKARKVKVRVEAALLFSYTLYSYSLNLNHWIRQKTCHCKGTQTSMSEKCTDQAAVVEPTISSPDISLHIQSESSPESTSLNESSNPNTPYSTSWKVSLFFVVLPKSFLLHSIILCYEQKTAGGFSPSEVFVVKVCTALLFALLSS